MTTGVLAGIARHVRSKAPMEVIERATITLAGGVEGDFRGAMKGQPHKRQVTLIEAGDWATAQALVGHNQPWQERRANLLVEGLDLPQRPGARLRVGTALLEVTIETAPCDRMEALADGLRAALTPDWRGGVCTKVIEEGAIAVGDAIGIEA
ncbi:MOSC domain-containing protein [Sphingomonas sp.]|jgi:MOSC domain-containing protein YiiM|uniref:MOSC domain-containing protein n=1 Tax=Sphingomonas sp. TaxID=28214 RepID=UPI002E2FE4BB|nr:MOSC domain-containing protein [Sphingomonas sp.]HEX4694065.1 MOSC domain-containing protein [Sphingomonas sp.]